MLSYPPGTFVPIAIATHGLVGLILGYVFDRPVAGLLAGLAPDADFLLPAVLGWPLVHRGLTHAALALVVVAGVGAVATDRRTVTALTAAYGSHLAIDITTPKGIPLVYPLVNERVYLDVGIHGHAPAVTLVFWLVGIAAVGLHFRNH